MKIPKVFVIILNFNGKDVLKDCVRSVFGSNYGNFEVVVVDNNSTDGSFEEVKLKFPKTHFIKNSANIGFSAGNNVGIRFALEKMADYVFLLNNDAQVEVETLTKLVEFAEKSKSLDVISPKILDKNGKNWFIGGNIDWAKMKTEHILFENEEADTDYVTGCAMLIKKEVFKKIGLFDENFFLYYEDADFCVRATRAGFGVGMDLDAVVHHKEVSNESNPEKVYWLVLSGLIFFKKNARWFWRLWYIPYLAARKYKNSMNLKKEEKIEDALKVRKAFEDLKFI